MTNEELEIKNLELGHSIEELEKKYQDLEHYINELETDKIKYNSIWRIICGVSVIALVIGIISLCVACPNRTDLEFDYSGSLVGILAILVTVLLGFQIYKVVEFDKKAECINNQNKQQEQLCKELLSKSEEKVIQIKDVAEHIEYKYGVIENALMDIYCDMYNSTKDNQLLFKIIFWGINTINTQSRLNCDLYLIADHTIEKLIGIIKKYTEFKCLYTEKIVLESMMDDIQHQNELPHYKELKMLVKKIECKEENK